MQLSGPRDAATQYHRDTLNDLGRYYGASCAREGMGKSSKGNHRESVEKGGIKQVHTSIHG